jgi:hypothetical protein
VPSRRAERRRQSVSTPAGVCRPFAIAGKWLWRGRWGGGQDGQLQGQVRVHRAMRAILSGARLRVCWDQHPLGAEETKIGAFAAFWAPLLDMYGRLERGRQWVPWMRAPARYTTRRRLIPVAPVQRPRQLGRGQRPLGHRKHRRSHAGYGLAGRACLVHERGGASGTPLRPAVPLLAAEVRPWLSQARRNISGCQEPAPPGSSLGRSALQC